MTEEKNEILKEIKRSFRSMMNGVASHSMREKGVEYKINWGVNLVNLRMLASKYDKDFEYIKKWIPEFGTKYYPKPIVEHKKAREKVLKVYKEALDNLD